MKTKDGDFIELCWEGGPEAFYIRGHIPFDRAMEILFQHIDEDAYKVSRPIHKYARWSCDARVEFDHSLMEYNTPGKGRFKITAFDCIW